MNIFNKLVTEAIKQEKELNALRAVVEKELLHHDILRILSQEKLLSKLTFIGGTCLRLCYDGQRLSEDLDFTGGIDYARDDLGRMANILIKDLQRKYQLEVQVSEPKKDTTNVDTWKIKIQTRPEQKNFPSQRINIDICAVSSFEKSPRMIINPYNVDMGTKGLIIQCQSLEEIFVDKLLAFALRPNRVKYRDVWDVLWLHQKAKKPNLHLVTKKLAERKLVLDDFVKLYHDRCKLFTNEAQVTAKEFTHEMRRFLPKAEIDKLINQEGFWQYTASLFIEFGTDIKNLCH